MKRLFSLIALSAVVAPLSALFADVSAPLGIIKPDQTLSVSWETYTDCAFDIIDANSGEVAASVSILYNAFSTFSNPYYGSSGSSNWADVSVSVGGTGAEITGLPSGDYRLQTYTKTPSKNQWVDASSTYEEIEDTYFGYNYLGCFFSVE